MKTATLCYLIDKDKGKILLGKKKYGGAKGKLNGFGGKVEPNDKTILDGVKREFFEETSMKLKNPELSAVLRFNFGKIKEGVAVYVYKCYKWNGDPKESSEMSVKWYKTGNVPIKKMWPSDTIWFPIVMNHSGVIINLNFAPKKDLPTEMFIKFHQELHENIREKNS